MHAVVVAVLAAVGLVLQSTALHVLSASAAVPDIPLILCVYLGLRQHSIGGALGAFVLGYVQDSFSGTAIGLNAFGMCLVYLLVYLTSRRLWVDNLISKVVVVFLASAIKMAAVTALLLLLVSPVSLSAPIVSSLLLQAALTAAVGPPIFSVLARTQKPVEEELP
jgi:rod shape-determining protein MreD